MASAANRHAGVAAAAATRALRAPQLLQNPSGLTLRRSYPYAISVA